MTIKTRQYKQSVINEMTKNDNKDKTIQTISYQRNDKKKMTIQTISYQRNEKKTIKTTQYKESVIDEMTRNDNKDKTIRIISNQ